jgi:hypothetical protein
MTYFITLRRCSSSENEEITCLGEANRFELGTSKYKSSESQLS